MVNKSLSLLKINKQDLKSIIKSEETLNSQSELWMFWLLLKLVKIIDFCMMKKVDSLLLVLKLLNPTSRCARLLKKLLVQTKSHTLLLMIQELLDSQIQILTKEIPLD